MIPYGMQDISDEDIAAVNRAVIPTVLNVRFVPHTP